MAAESAKGFIRGNKSHFFKWAVTIVIACHSYCAAAQGLYAGSGFATQSLEACSTDLKRLNHVVGWQVEWPRRWQSVVANGPEGVPSAIAQWQGFELAIQSAVDDLKVGLKEQRAAPKVIAEHVLQQLQDLSVNLKASESPFKFAASASPQAKQWNEFVDQSLAPAIGAYADFIKNHYIPKASNRSGLADANVERCYFSAAQWWTSLDLDAAALKRIGWHYLEQTKAELTETAAKNESFDDVLARLKAIENNDNVSREDIVLLSERAIAKANQKLQPAFKYALDAKIEVVEMPLYLQAAAPAGYYQAKQGQMPAQYIVNTSRPSERRLMAEVLAFHEGIPGHHLWQVYPREVASVGYNSGLLEGWAIYAEFLADELNLYSSLIDRQGMLAKHLWAASRLIVEPGLHLEGWSRDEAIVFMQKNTLLSKSEIEIEVDRYIAMPGQSLGYILGADVILSERAAAKNTLGETFDLAMFHDVVLQKGVRSLPQVREDIRGWVKSVATR